MIFHGKNVFLKLSTSVELLLIISFKQWTKKIFQYTLYFKNTKTLFYCIPHIWHTCCVFLILSSLYEKGDLYLYIQIFIKTLIILMSILQQHKYQSICTPHGMYSSKKAHSLKSDVIIMVQRIKNVKTQTISSSNFLVYTTLLTTVFLKNSTWISRFI